MQSKLITFLLGLIIFPIISCNTKHQESLKRLETPARLTRVFVFNSINSKQYPICHASFIEAIHNWAEVIPVHFVITYDTSAWGINVIYADLDAPPFDLPGVAGFWDPDWHVGLFQTIPLIALDADDLEKDHRITKLGIQAVNTAMHEIGHMLGLDHVRGPGVPLHDGILVESKDLAERCIMAESNHILQEIQPLEVELVKEILNIPDSLGHHKGYVTFFMPPKEEPQDADGRDSTSPPESK